MSGPAAASAASPRARAVGARFDHLVPAAELGLAAELAGARPLDDRMAVAAAEIKSESSPSVSIAVISGWISIRRPTLSSGIASPGPSRKVPCDEAELTGFTTSRSAANSARASSRSVAASAGAIRLGTMAMPRPSKSSR